MLKLSEKENFTAPCALLLGGFDGLHAGHASLVEEAKKTGLPVGLTSIVGGKAGGDIFTFPEREYIYERAGITFALEIAFTEQFKNITAEEFLFQIFAKINAKAVFCGEDFRFGKGAAGDAALLKNLAPCPVHALPVLFAGGEKIASSKVKELLSQGDVQQANRILRGDYFLAETVEYGRSVGRTLGFPTANLAFPAGKFPLREGVYRGVCTVREREYPAIVNFGSRPTFGVSEKKVEAYLEGFEGVLYGETVRIFPQEFLRPVVRFDSKEELIKQLEQDKKSLKKGSL